MRKGRNRERWTDDSRDREIARYWLIYLQKQRGPHIGSQYTGDPRSQWYGQIQKSTGYIAIKSVVSVVVQRQEEPRIPTQSSQVPGAHSPQVFSSIQAFSWWEESHSHYGGPFAPFSPPVQMWRPRNIQMMLNYMDEHSRLVILPQKMYHHIWSSQLWVKKSMLHSF